MGKKHILIVDDQKEMLLLLSSALETLSYDFQISLARSGEEALLEATMNHVDLLICDIILPGMDGFEVMQNFQKQHSSTKILLISGTQDESIKKKIAQAGATAFFFKPIILSDFLDTIERTLELVETILPNEINSFKEQNENFEDFQSPPMLISKLHAEIEAECILLLNYKGEISSNVGVLSGEFKNINYNPNILTMLYNPVSIAQSLKTNLKSNLALIKINQKYIGLSAITTNFGLLLLFTKQPTEKTIQSIFDINQKLYQKLTQNTDMLSQYTLENEENNIVTAELVDQRMEETLSSQKIKTAQLKNFWEEAIQETTFNNNEEGLNYDQAKILGLTPEE